MKKALTTTAAAMLALSAYAQSATSEAGAGAGSATSGISAGPTGTTGSTAAGTLPSARPTVNRDGPLGAFWSQDSARLETSNPQRLGGPIGVTTRPTSPAIPNSTTSIDPRVATRPGLVGPTTETTSPTVGLPPANDLDSATPRTAINDSSRWELDMPEGAVGAPGTGAFQTGSARSIPSTGGSPRAATGALPPAPSGDLTQQGEPVSTPRSVLNQAGGASTTDSTTVVEGRSRTDSVTSAGSAASLNATGVETPAAVNEAPLDRALSAKIRSRLSETGSANDRLAPQVARDIRITTRNGRVTLEGTVNSEAERRVIEKRARSIQGIGELENRIIIRGQGSSATSTEGSSSSAPRTIEPSRPSTFNPSGAPATGEAGSDASSGNDLDLDDRHSEILPPPQ